MRHPRPEHISLADFLVWEQQQPDRFEWIDGTVVPCSGVSFEHGTISLNLSASFHAAVASCPCFVQPSDRQLIPRDANGRDVGSFYADLFVSCAASDRTGRAAHAPTVVVEVLSQHVGGEFTDKREAYLGSAALVDYLIVNSRRRHVYRYSWKATAENGRRLVTCEYRKGPVVIPSLGLTLGFEQIYAGTNVPAILHPISSAKEVESDIVLD